MFHQSSEKMPVTFKDVTACFSEEEWKLLHEREKLFYIDVMQKIHQALITLGVHQGDHKNPKSRADLHNPTSSHDPVTDPIPDIFLRIQYKEEQSWRDLQSSEETEIGPIPSTGPLMVSPNFSLQIKEEEEPNSLDSDGGDALAYDTGPLMTAPDFLLQIKQEGEPGSMGSACDAENENLVKTESLQTNETKYNFQREKWDLTDEEHEQFTELKKLVHLQNNQILSWCTLENGTLVKTECLQNKQRKFNFQKEKWDLTDEEHEQSTELIKKLVHLQNCEIPCTSVECEKHTTDNTKDRPFKSTEFKKTFSELSAEGKQFECTDCEKHFTNASNLKRHQRIHTGVKPYECSECEKSFIDSTHLKIHYRIHTGEKPFDCRECKKCFRRRTNLKEHQKFHTGEKPYECTKCKKIFTRLSSVKKHQRIHTREKPIECSVCKLCFTPSFLKVHQRTHTGEKPYECTICKQMFTQISGLKRHQKSHTGEKTYEC